ncbi:MAG: MotA/TolQ/ExbB proton channel family protein [Gemmatimonadota bacterium]
MRIVGIVLCILVMMVGIGSNLSAMIDIPSLIIVLGGTFGMLLLGGSPLVLMLRSIVSVPAAEPEARAAARGWRMARIYALASGILGDVIGWVIMLKNVDDPAAIGPGMAIALLTSFYGILLAFVLCLPCQANIEKSYVSEGDGSAVVTGVLSILYTTFMVISAFAILHRFAG